jgi:2-keto-4-pentenoate hydratase/2-oxohepta-3-ene-1,7-dioic acid hydratase in catechol pathway
MRLVTFQPPLERTPHLGCEQHARIVDLTALAAARGTPLPVAMRDFVRADALPVARSALAAATSDLLARHSHADGAVRRLAPLQPGKILCSGLNYHSHIQENPSARLPDEPFFFAKLPSAVIGPGDAIVLPARSRQVDYEVEFAVVLGRTLRRAAPAEVPAAIFGYTILHDVSARDVQMKDQQITLGKNFDTFCPLGPCLVTADEIPDPAALRLRSRVNGELRQNGSNRDWIFPLPRLLSELSHVMTLEPGDLVSTGTPAGVGLFRQPPVFLRGGDVVEVEVDGIGCLRNPVAAA